MYFQFHLDDIPIQSLDESGTNNTGHLVSITEETDGGSTEGQLGMRNSLVRSSKEILKTHKVPFPGFKKLKDKDKDKDRDATNANSGSSSGVPMSVNNNGMSSTTKPQPMKNGSISVDGAKESMIITATKQLTKKDKKLSSAGLQAINVDTNDAAYLDRTSPLLQMKRKSSSVDVTSNGTASNSIDLQMTSFANGSANGDLVASIDANIMMGGEMNTDLTSTVNDASKTASASGTNNMQISQV